MMGRKIVFAIFIALTVAPAWAGAPLKGVDVKLGRNPGGSPAARTTNSDGKIDFGVLPAGSYYIVIVAPKQADLKREPDLLIEIQGARGGTVKRRWNYAQKKAFSGEAAPSAARVTPEVGTEKILFTSDGTHPVVIAASTVIRSKSNITNN